MLDIYNIILHFCIYPCFVYELNNYMMIAVYLNTKIVLCLTLIYTSLNLCVALY